jgi:Spy/CpxP family protein refolding chaperone
MTRVVVILGFLVAFSAGLVVGLNVRREPVTVAGTTTKAVDRRVGPGGPGGFLATHLNLSPEQRQAMDKIWSEFGGRMRWEQDKKRHQCRDERDEAIAALVRPADYDKYDQILKNYTDRLADLDKQAKASFEKAVEDTKKILNPEQREKYERFLKQHEGPRRDRGDRDRKDGKDGSERDHDKNKEHGRRPDSRATTRGK